MFEKYCDRTQLSRSPDHRFGSAGFHWKEVLWRTVFAVFLMLSLPARDALLAEAPVGKKGEQSSPPPVSVEVPDASVDKSPFWKIFVPYRALKSFSVDPAGTVFLPYEQFQKLWEAAQRQASQAPEIVQVTTADYSAVSDDKNVMVHGTITFHSASRAWAKATLDFGNGKPSRVQWLDAGPVISQNERGLPEVLIPASGTYRAEFDIVFPVTTRGGELQTTLHLPAAPVANLQFTVNRPNVSLGLKESLPVTAIPPEGTVPSETSKVKVVIGGISSLNFFWPTAERPVTPEERLFTSEQQMLFRITSDKAFVEAKFRLERLRGSWGKVQISFPKQFKIVNVNSSQISGWEGGEEGERRLLHVVPARESEPTLNLSVLLEAPLSEGALDLTGTANSTAIQALGAVRESGTAGFIVPEDLELNYLSRQGLVRLNTAEVPDEMRLGRGEYFRYYTTAYQLKFSVQEIQPRYRVQSVTRILVTPRDVRLNAVFNLDVDKAGLFLVPFRIPEGLVITSVQSPEMRDFSLAPDGSRLNVALKQRVLGSLQIQIEGKSPFPSAATVINTPSIEPLGAIHEEGRLSIQAPEELEVTTEPSKVVGVLPANESLSPVGGYRIVSNWVFSSRPVQIPLSVSRKPPRITSLVDTSIVLRPKFAEVSSQVRYEVAYSGVDKFVLLLPDIPRVSVRIEGGGEENLLKQAIPSDSSVAGWKTWTLETQREVLGPVQFQVRYDLPLSEPGEEGVKLEVQPPRALHPGIESVVTPVASSGEISVAGDEEWSVSAIPEGVDEIDVRELKRLSGSAAIAYRYFENPAANVNSIIRITAEKLGRRDVVRTIVSRSLIETVMTYEQMALFRCRYRLTSSERQRLGIQLPANVEPLHVSVAGKTVVLESSASSDPKNGQYYINVDRPTPADQGFSIQLIYRTPINPVSRQYLRGPLQIDLPRLGVNSGEEQPAIQEQRLAVWTPQEISLVGTPGNFRLVHPPRGTSHTAEESMRVAWEHWIGENSASGVEFPLVGHVQRYLAIGGISRLEVQWWRWNWVVILISLSLILVGWILRKTTWYNRISFTLLAAFCVLLLGFSNPDLVKHLFLASQFGLLAVVILWGWTSLSGMLKSGNFSSGSPGGIQRPWGKVIAPVIPPPGIFRSGGDSSSIQE